MYSVIVSLFVQGLASEIEKQYYYCEKPEETGRLIAQLAEKLKHDEKITILKLRPDPHSKLQFGLRPISR